MGLLTGSIPDKKTAALGMKMGIFLMALWGVVFFASRLLNMDFTYQMAYVGILTGWLALMISFGFWLIGVRAERRRTKNEAPKTG